MKYKLLAMSTEPQVNIGDYIQALAASQFLPNVDGFIERECLDRYSGDISKVIMNGWYMHHPENWPPSEKIKPLFVAMHINSKVKDALTSDANTAYLKMNQPIGCRDMYTVDLLSRKGINAYFSACLTLTLGQKYHNAEKEDTCYFVDPCVRIGKKNILLCLLSFIFFLFHFSSVIHIYKKYPMPGNAFKKLILISNFYRQYRTLFTDETLINAEYICQESRDYKDNFNTNEDRLKEAERLVKKYAKAKLVVTSRIHCALPCLGLETPVLYTYNADQNEISSCRMGGLKELFNIVEWTNGYIKSMPVISERLSKHNTILNNNQWKEYRDMLVEKCSSFID